VLAAPLAYLRVIDHRDCVLLFKPWMRIISHSTDHLHQTENLTATVVAGFFHARNFFSKWPKKHLMKNARRMGKKV